MREKLDEADKEFADTKKVFDLSENVQDHKTRVATAASMRKDIEDTCKAMTDACTDISKLAQKVKTSELEAEVCTQKNAFFVDIQYSVFIYQEYCNFKDSVAS